MQTTTTPALHALHFEFKRRVREARQAKQSADGAGWYPRRTLEMLDEEIAALVGLLEHIERTIAPTSVDQPSPVVGSSDWLGEAEAALVLAEKALNNAGLEGEWDSLPKLERGVRGLREGIEARRRTSPSEKLTDAGGRHGS